MPATRLLHRPARMLVRRLNPALVLIVAWSLISLGTARRYGVYTPLAIVLVSLGMLVLTGGLLLVRLPVRHGPSRLSLLVGCVVAVLSNLITPADRYAKGTVAIWSHALMTAAAIGLVLLVFLPARSRLGRLAGPVVLVLATLAGIAGIRATPAPTIDDFHILQGSARALLHGHNIYGHAWPGSEGHLLPYFPGSVILVTPFYLISHDVRYGLLAALLVAGWLVGRLDPRRRLSGSAPGGRLAVLAGLVMLFPWALYLVEQSWPEPLLLVLLVAMVWAVLRGRLTVALLCFAAALAIKQTAFILVPLAGCWPVFGWRRTAQSVAGAAVVILAWFAVNPHQFVQGAIRYNLTLPPRHDSLSLFNTAMRHGYTPSFVLVPVLMLLALAACWWLLPRSSVGFVLGAAWLMGVFNLLNKQSFFNEWALVSGLIVLGVALLAVPTERAGR